MRHKNKTILTVDDTPANIRLLTHYLQKEGYNVITAEDGFEGFKAAIKYHPDLILLDVMMPGTDGYEVCELLKAEEETKDIPIVFLTAKAEVEDKVKGFELGAVDYITKPFNLIEIATRVENQLEFIHVKKQNARYQSVLGTLIHLANLGTLSKELVDHFNRMMDIFEKKLKVIKNNSNKDGDIEKEVSDLLKSVEGLRFITGKIREAVQKPRIRKEEVDIKIVMDDVFDLITEGSDNLPEVEFSPSEDVEQLKGDYVSIFYSVLSIIYELSRIKNVSKIKINAKSGKLSSNLIKDSKKRDRKTYLALEFMVYNGSKDGEALIIDDKVFSDKVDRANAGLNLYSIDSVVKSLDGVVEIKKSQSKGAKMVVYLPSASSVE